MRLRTLAGTSRRRHPLQLQERGVQQTQLRILQELASVGSTRFDCLTILAVYVVGRGGGT
ncbi:hypothetical protein [Frankia sp. AgB32]|uniref:hypothetical protein n=1 Tax=Frankia sp. AgB32 TaxID=631119 RepID=UPI00200D40D1|nr:hypothetical protein [Frankia sp. AgB32]MCK9895185.1 hypothetical protein [Frankia sp. AgB32]